MTFKLDLQPLLHQISTESPSGYDLRTETGHNALYSKIKDARSSARAIERQWAQGNNSQTALSQWQLLHDLCLAALSTHTKDLEIAAWLTEALLRLQGFAGLHTGLILLKGLCEQFWHQLYPRPDEEGLATSLAALTALNGQDYEGTLLVPIAMTALTAGTTVGPFALWQYQQALELARSHDLTQRQQSIEQGTVTLELITAAAAETSPLFFQQLLQDLQACLTALQQLNDCLKPLSQEAAPPTSKIRQQLLDCLTCVETISGGLVTAATEDAQAVTPTNSLATLTTTTVTPPSDAAHQREQMLQTLLQVADYFRRTEPHSPLSYMLERVVRWGRLSLPELLQELVKDQQAWKQLGDLTGIYQSAK